MEDYLIRATAASGSIRAFAAYTKNTVEAARQIHQTSPVVSAALGRLLTAAAMMGSMLKGEKDLVTLQVRGDGPMQGLLATGDSQGRVKGYPFVPDVEIPLKYAGKLDVGGAIGRGMLHVIRDIGLKEPYAGSCALVSGEIAEDLAQYFAVSEQAPSAVSLGVLVDVDCTIMEAGGFMLQLMPDASEEAVSFLEGRISELPGMTEMLQKSMKPEEILEMLFRGMDLCINEKRPIQFHCACSRERVEKALISLGREELETILREDGKTSLHCHFCNREYPFSGEELAAILAEL